jgi:hypothetical protein
MVKKRFRIPAIMTSQRCPPLHTHAFTLIELLVVISYYCYPHSDAAAGTTASKREGKTGSVYEPT